MPRGEYLEGFQIIGLQPDRLPNLAAISARLGRAPVGEASQGCRRGQKFAYEEWNSNRCAGQAG